MTTGKTTKGKLLYEGKAKQLFEGPEPGTLIQHFKDDATAFNAKKHEVISGKGVLNNRISEFLMIQLMDLGIPTHFIRSLNMREQLVQAVEIIPVEVVIRNRVAGSFAKRFNATEGDPLPYPIIEHYLKSDELDDPMITEEHIYAFDLADPVEMEEIRALAMRINDYMSGLFRGIGFTLIDFKVEFGRIYTEEGVYIVLADEISPDCCRLWDVETGDKFDKDIFRQDLGDLTVAYREVARRLGVLQEVEPTDASNTEAPEKAAPKKPAPTTRKKKK